MDVLTQKQKRVIEAIDDIERIEADELDEYIMDDILSFISNNMRHSDIQ